MNKIKVVLEKIDRKKAILNDHLIQILEPCML